MKLEFLDKLAQFWDLQVSSVHREEEGGSGGRESEGVREGVEMVIEEIRMQKRRRDKQKDSKVQ